MLQLMYLELGKILKQLEREEKSEKNKKNEREDGCLRLHWYRGEGDSVHSGLLCIVLQRFATLVCFVAYGFNMRDIGE